jgi:glutaredoxin-related protein
MEELEQINVKFEYTDIFKQTTKFEQTLNINSEEDDNLYLMVQEFKLFLSAIGYSAELVNSVQVVE